MRWVLLVVAVAVVIVVVLVVLVAVIGALLPRHHEASVSARLGAPPGDVFATVADFAAWPSWNPEVTAMRRDADRDGRPRWVMSSRHGDIASLVNDLRPPQGTSPGRIETVIDDPSLPFGGSWEWTFAADGAGTIVTITERGEVRNPIFRFLSRVVFGHEATMRSFLRALASRPGSR